MPFECLTQTKCGRLQFSEIGFLDFGFTMNVFQGSFPIKIAPVSLVPLCWGSSFPSSIFGDKKNKIKLSHYESL